MKTLLTHPQGLSLRVPAGSSCAVVGRSGSGKSTLMRLLFRMYDTQKGTIRINGTDIHQASRGMSRASPAGKDERSGREGVARWC